MLNKITSQQMTSNQNNNFNEQTQLSNDLQHLSQQVAGQLQVIQSDNNNLSHADLGILNESHPQMLIH